MTSRTSLATEIQARIDAAGLTVPADVLAGCAEYLQLLARWNQRINLTALALDFPVPASTIDKLIVEPLCGIELFPSGDPSWLDLGSGGGSPAIPLRLACRNGSLEMVESRERKAAFLREAIRALALPRTQVLATRFDQLGFANSISVITLRAVRVDANLVASFRRWLKPGGSVLCFGSAWEGEGFKQGRQRPLPDGSLLHELLFH